MGCLSVPSFTQLMRPESEHQRIPIILIEVCSCNKKKTTFTQSQFPKGDFSCPRFLVINFYRSMFR